MSTISLCMIVKNEESNLPKCLDSIADLVDEVIIVDTGSTDNTKAVALKYPNVKLYDFKWVDDFSKARNFAFSKATMEYQMWIDADEELLDEDRKRFNKMREYLCSHRPDRVTCFTMMLGHGNGSILKYRRNRIVRKDKDFKWEGMVHECLDPKGTVYDSDIEITHKRTHSNTTRNLDIFKKHEAAGVRFTSRDLTYYGRELFWNGYYKESIRVLNEYLERPDTWLEDVITSMKICAQCHMHLGDKSKAKMYLVRTFAYTAPRAEIMYLLATICESEGDLDSAIAWLKAITVQKIPDIYGFIELSEWTWKPYLQLTKLLWQKGDIEGSKEAHNEAWKLNQTDSRIIYNEALFGYPNSN